LFSEKNALSLTKFSKVSAMIRFLKTAAPLAMLAVAACATPFKANVSRFQQMPAAQGQTFAIRAENPRLDDSLEFQTYANQVAQRLTSFGYTRATDAASANLVVSLDYGVDKGRERVRSTPGSGFGRWGYSGFGSPYGWGGYGGFGYPHYGFGRRAFLYGFYDPFLFDDYNDVESYTVYSSQLDLKIARKGTNERVFEGTAKAMSTDDDLTTLVPNLIEAMFTGFPGNSGETVKITVAPPSKRSAQR
jgi:Domain of unknown function (DUF4136)